MAILKLEYGNEASPLFDELRKLFPVFRAQTMGYVGMRGRDILVRQFLSGQEIDLRVYPRDKIGRRTASYSVGKRAAQVSIASYPMNFFEHGRNLRSGKREPGKKVITRKLKSAMASQLQSILSEFDRTILQKEVDRIG